MKQITARHTVMLQRSDKQSITELYATLLALLFVPITLISAYNLFDDGLAESVGIFLFSLILSLVLIMSIIPLLMSAYVYLSAKHGRLRMDKEGIHHTTNLPVFMQKFQQFIPNLDQGALAYKLPKDWSITWDEITMMRLVPSAHSAQNPGPTQVLLEIFSGPKKHMLFPYQWLDPKGRTPDNHLNRTFFFSPPSTGEMEKALLNCPVMKYLEQSGVKVHIDPAVYEFGGRTQRIGLMVILGSLLVLTLATLPFVPPFNTFFGPKSTVTATKASEKHELPAVLPAKMEHGANVITLAFSPDGKTLASGGGSDEEIRLWDAETGSWLKSLHGHKNNLEALAFSPDSRLLASGSQDDTIRIWSMETHKTIRKLTSPAHTSINHEGFYSVAFSPDGTLLAGGNWNGSFTLWRTEDWSEVYTVEPSPGSFLGWIPGDGDGHANSIDALAFSPDGALIATGSFDDTIKIWETTSGKLLRTLTGHTDWIYDLAFSPDGKQLLSGSEDLALILWDVASGEINQVMTGHKGAIYAVAFSPDGKLLASGSKFRTVKFHEASTGFLLKSEKPHKGYVNDVVFSSDGKRMASASEDDSVKLWKVKERKRKKPENLPD